MSSQTKYSDLQSKVLEYFQEKNYSLISPPINQIKSTTIIKYICICKNEKNKTFRDLVRRGCRDCNNLKLKEVPTDFSVIPKEFKDEKWVPITGGFISDKGKCINSHGKLLTADEKGRYFTNGKLQYASILMANAFNIENVDKLNGNKSNHIVRSVTNEIIPSLENIRIGTREEIGREHGKKSRQSDNFKESNNTSLFDKTKKYDYKKIKDLPHHIIFSDGSIWNENRGQGGMRFLTFSLTKKEKLSNTYYSIYINNITYKIHRLVCIAFHPIDGKENYEDYKDLQVNHKDGNTLNNNADNLEWVTRSENINHAYSIGLNNKVRNVIQYENVEGKEGTILGEYISVAEASRQTGISEHEIRNSCKNKGKYIYFKFLWKYKNEKETDKYTNKFSSKIKYTHDQKELIDDKFNLLSTNEDEIIIEDSDDEKY
jgi:hypothetical protein